MRGKVAFVLGAAVGYVLGTRAGRQRYEQIKRGAEKLWNTTPVQRGVGAVRNVVDDRIDEAKIFIRRASADAFSNLARQAEARDRQTAAQRRASQGSAGQGEASADAKGSDSKGTDAKSSEAKSSDTKSTGSKGTGAKGNAAKSAGAKSSGKKGSDSKGDAAS